VLDGVLQGFEAAEVHRRLYLRWVAVNPVRYLPWVAVNPVRVDLDGQRRTPGLRFEGGREPQVGQNGRVDPPGQLPRRFHGVAHVGEG
jgi:hypothetical protein